MSFRFGLVARDLNQSIEPDDVTSTCGIDPRDLTFVNPILGRANDENSQEPTILGLSAFRTCPPSSGNDTVTFQVTGLSYTGYTAGAIVVVWEGPSGPIWTSDPFWIDPASSARNSMDFPVTMGYPASPTAPTPMRVSAHLWGYNSGGWAPLRHSWVITIGI
jgi:hypothetical protein